MKPDFSFEHELAQKGVKYIAGVDEAGRGPLAGSVVAAAVMFDFKTIEKTDLLVGLNDSKKISAQRREKLFEIILENAFVCIVSTTPKKIEQLNIRGASLYAMRRAVLGLAQMPEHVLIDGNAIPNDMPVSASAIIKGDGKSLSIAAASIVAKVMRDKICVNMDIDYPDYGFAKHKAYGTKVHIEALNEFGACKHHRVSFAPVAKTLAKN